MANLPNKPFVFNYNARDYNPSTFTIPKTSGQTMDRDMVWTATTSSIRDQIAFDEDHISVPLSAYSLFDFSTVNENPMNNLPSSPAMTIIVKFKTTDISKGSNLICNRDLATYNWMARVGANSSRVLTLHTLKGNTGASESVSYTQSSVITAVWRVNTDRKIEIKNLTEGTSNTPFTSAWQAGSYHFSFFVWYYSGAPSEPMSGDFYWCYASREVLTDEEIQQVIAFNESKFGPDTTGTTIAASGGTETTNLDSETGWTATTTSPWITISPASGESGTTAITFTIKKNLFSARTGVVTFTSDAGDVAEYTITQEGQDKVAPINKMYQGTRRIN